MLLLSTFSLSQSAKDEFQSDESLAGYQLGQVHFTVQYDIRRSVLTITLIRATNLSPRGLDWNKLCNPYAIVQLLPDYKHQLQVSVFFGCCKPIPQVYSISVVFL